MHGFVDIIQNDPEVPAGVFAELLREWRVPFRVFRADLGEALPVVTEALIVLGGTMGVHDEARHPFLNAVKVAMRRALADGTPLFGICLGGQLLADLAGGVVTSGGCGEKGVVTVSLTAAGTNDPLFAGVAAEFPVFQWHDDSFAVPPGAAHLAASAACPGQALRLGTACGVQFHPEVDAAIVAAWSRGDDNRVQLQRDFAAVAQSHRQLARQLLGNFLCQAGFPPQE
jgi:GMP synthase-like glutamine amidotransferase